MLKGVIFNAVEEALIGVYGEDEGAPRVELVDTWHNKRVPLNISSTGRCRHLKFVPCLKNNRTTTCHHDPPRLEYLGRCGRTLARILRTKHW